MDFFFCFNFFKFFFMNHHIVGGKNFLQTGLEVNSVLYSLAVSILYLQNKDMKDLLGLPSCSISKKKMSPLAEEGSN